MFTQVSFFRIHHVKGKHHLQNASDVNVWLVFRYGFRIIAMEKTARELRLHVSYDRNYYGILSLSLSFSFSFSLHFYPIYHKHLRFYFRIISKATNTRTYRSCLKVNPIYYDCKYAGSFDFNSLFQFNRKAIRDKIFRYAININRRILELYH